MSLTTSDHYAVSALYMIGGTLSVVSHLWLLASLLPKVKMEPSRRSFHTQLGVANLSAIVLYFLCAICHFKQEWIFGSTACTLYVFWCYSAPTVAVGLLAVCLYNEYKIVSQPSNAKNTHTGGLVLLAWISGISWGIGAITWAEYGVEPAGYTCTVIWYEVQLYVTCMTVFGYAIPAIASIYYAWCMWSKGLLTDNPLAKSAVGLFLTMSIQLGGYSGGYLYACLGWELSYRAISFPSIWMKVLGSLHPFVYHLFLSDNLSDKMKAKATK